MHPHGVQLYCLKVRTNAVLIWCFARTSLSYTLLNSQPLLLPDLDFRSDMFAYTSRYLFLIVLSQHLNYYDMLRSNNAYRTVLLSNCSYYKRFLTGKQGLFSAIRGISFKQNIGSPCSVFCYNPHVGGRRRILYLFSSLEIR